MSNTKLPFSMAPGAPDAPPEHGALVSCLSDAHGDHFRSGSIMPALDRLLNGKGLAMGEPYRSDLFRVSNRDNDELVELMAPESITPSDFVVPAEIAEADFIAICDPDDFGEHYWHTYSEEEFRRIIEHTLSVWAAQEPAKKKEYALALAGHGMCLTPINLAESANPPNAHPLGKRRKPGLWQRLFGRDGR